MCGEDGTCFRANGCRPADLVGERQGHRDDQALGVAVGGDHADRFVDRVVDALLLFQQHAVDTEAHAETILVGFDVDVRRIFLDGFRQDRVDETDDRGVVVALEDAPSVPVRSRR